MIKIGLLGFGTVGSGVYEIITHNKGQLLECTGQNLSIEKILVRDIEKYRELTVPPTLFTVNPSDILNNPDIDIVVEVMGGMEPACSYMKWALRNGKHVVTANKMVLSKHLEELLSLAEENNRELFFEASVGGGIPIIKALRESIKINKISEIKGILNGTTNFILSKMYDDNLSFPAALKLAQDCGYAEADPTDDIEGYDAARKISILTSLAFKTKANVEDILCKGITSISPLDINFFKQMGFSVKLLGSSLFKNDQLSVSVEPVLVNESSPFASVKDAFNMISITGDIVGELQFFGQGAGKKPTANAVVSDIIDILNKQYKMINYSPCTSNYPVNATPLKKRYYIRVTIGSKEQTGSILEILNHCKLKYEIQCVKEHLVLITEKASVLDMERIAAALRVNHNDLCYIKIDSPYGSSLDNLWSKSLAI